MNDARPLPPLPPELARLVQRLVDLRNSLQETALALSDYQFTLESAERHAAQIQAQEILERAKAQDYSNGEGH